MMRKKFVAIVACVAMLMTCFPVAGFAASSVKYWTWDDSQKKMVETEYEKNDYSIIDENTALNSWGQDDGQDHWYIVKGKVNIASKVTVKGHVHLILQNNAELIANKGIEIVDKKSSDENFNSLSIYSESLGSDMGTLKAYGDASNSGIYIDKNNALNIYGGNIDVKGGDSSNSSDSGAGIGGNSAGEEGAQINIYDGKIIAMAGICTADKHGDRAGINGGHITIFGGSITAKSKDSAAIGGNFERDGGVIVINGGMIKATSTNGAGIGGGAHGGSGEIHINGGLITAESQNGAGVGSGEALVTYRWTTVGSGIVPQYVKSITRDTNKLIEIKSGEINVVSENGAGIGGGYYQYGGPINIYDGDITASSDDGACIGTGSEADEASGKTSISIYGGQITAINKSENGYGGTAIGGGYRSSGDQIMIQGGTIIAVGAENAYAIGNSGPVDGTDFSTGEKGHAVIFVDGGIPGITDDIGDASSEDWSLILFKADDNGLFTGRFYGDEIAPTEDFSVPENATLTIQPSETLILDGITMTIDGDSDDEDDRSGIVTNYSTIKKINGGKIVNNGILNSKEGSIDGDDDQPVLVEKVLLNESAITLTVDQSETLIATVIPDDATNKNVTWESSNEKVAKVDNGKVTAISTGNAKITVTTVEGTKTATCTVTVVAAPIKVTGVTLDKTATTLKSGESLTLKAAVAPADATNKDVSWSSNDTNVATVDSNGVVKAIAPGKATITVTTQDGSKTAQCIVTVEATNIAVTGVSLDKTSASLEVKDTLTLKATISPVNANNQNLTWISSDNKVATVKDGVVTAIAPGEATITVKTVDGEKTATCKVTVKAQSSQPTDPSDPEEPVYQPDITDTDNGTVSVTPSNPQEGDTVTITPKPDQGYEVDDVVVTDEDGNELEVTENADGSFTFVQPEGEVTITVTFKENKDEPTDPADPSELPFGDVKTSDWFYDPVKYVYDKGLMTGTSATEFAPNLTTTRGMIVSILHRLEGGPVVENDAFSDVSSDDWYGQSVAWAASVGVVNGFEDGTFRPNDPITREQMAAILYNYSQYKGYDVSARADLSKYSDAASVSSWATEVLSWANAEGLVNGMTKTTLDPQASATRAQVATILMRYTQMIGE